ncbi:MAG: hypothetical protein V7K40_24515 [Nostoc sp.]|uniref:hypothetical protein n=1 Tax=Nostoc sp. TaxID=1180 RepID=UPI002FFD25BE
MLNEIITIYAITDNFLKAIRLEYDIRRDMNDAEIITTALVAAIFFNSNHNLCLQLYARPQFSTEFVIKITI